MMELRSRIYPIRRTSRQAHGRAAGRRVAGPCARGVDEKAEVQAVERARPERRASDHVRHGTCSLFAALDVAVGRVIGRRCWRRRAEEFRDLLEAVNAAVSSEVEVHLVLDGASIHEAPLVRDWLTQPPVFHGYGARIAAYAGAPS